MRLSSLKIFLLTKTLKRKGVYLFLVAVILAIFCLPEVSSLAYYKATTNSYFSKIQQIVSLNLKEPPEILQIYVTAYSSSPVQTDDTPCITASGYDLCRHNKENVVACNFLPFGSKVKFPELDPDQFYTVVDRMNERYGSRMDIWMTSKQEAKAFGIKYLTVEIYK